MMCRFQPRVGLLLVVKRSVVVAVNQYFIVQDKRIQEGVAFGGSEVAVQQSRDVVQ